MFSISELYSIAKLKRRVKRLDYKMSNGIIIISVTVSLIVNVMRVRQMEII